jgi:hypothetical protein
MAENLAKRSPTRQAGLLMRVDNSSQLQTTLF